MTRLSPPRLGNRSNRRTYGQVPSSNSFLSEGSSDEEAQELREQHEHADDPEEAPPANENSPLDGGSRSSSNSRQDDGTSITITILDTAHSKFDVRADPSWTVARFKRAGTARHGVAASGQRLIYMGRLLDDMTTLEECGLGASDSAGEENKIVHLFPKPNVVVRTEDEHGDVNTALSAGGNGGDSSAASNPNTGSPAGSSGAHVPQIYLDANEASSPVLILSSQEIFEAMHRVKLLSFLLLIMSSMELLTLFSIMMGGVPDTDAANGYSSYGGGGGYEDIPPGDPTDTGPPTPSYNGQQVQMRTWRNSDYADLAVSCLGLYVSTLGIKATTESTVFLARQYFYGLVLAGLAWNGYQYFLNVQIYKEAEEAAEQAAEDADDGGGGGGGGLGPNEAPDYGSPYSAAFGTLMIPLCVWFMCWFRAWEFQSLMVAAEEEAHERSRMLTSGQDDDRDVEEGASGSEDDDESSERERQGTNEEAPQVVDETEFSVQVEGRTIT